MRNPLWAQTYTGIPNIYDRSKLIETKTEMETPGCSCLLCMEFLRITLTIKIK
jgi:hypothetical protein